MINKELSPKLSIPMRIYQNIKLILPIAIILIIISPLTCKLIFNNSDLSIYFAMVNIMGLFILLYDISFEHIKNKKLLIFSLLIGLSIKIILIVPLINSFYRMGYNLIYGDILSTSLGMFISYLINYIYIRRITKTTENYFEKLLDILYSNIILTIILVLLEFIIPIKASSYLKSLGIMIIYLIVAITIIKIKKNKK
jgi:O-antigen/teichoic acid export membrane protein